jgi:putative hemolysin
MDELKITERTIHLEKVFREKNKGTSRYIPGFIFSILRKIVHEKEINAFMWDYRDLAGLPFVDMLVKDFGAIVSYSGLENIPEEGRFIISANHPLGGLDGIVLMHVLGKVKKNIVFPVNDILLFIPNLQPLFIPINKHGSNMENLRIIDETFAGDKTMMYFPAGLVSRKQKGKIEDLEWKKTFISKAIKFKRDIIPTYIDGRNSNFFYALANWRKRLNIKANIEMLFLPNEMFRQKNRPINIIIGKPIPYQTFDKTYNFNQWAAKVKTYVYAMGKGEKEPFDPKRDY